MSGRHVAGTPGRRPRVDCPVCGRDVALTPKTGVIGRHLDPRGYACGAAGTLPGRDAHREEIRLLKALVAKYPEQARKMVGRLP